MRGASALDVAIQLRQWAMEERNFGQSIEYSSERPPGARDVLAFVRGPGARSLRRRTIPLAVIQRHSLDLPRSQTVQLKRGIIPPLHE